MDPESDGLFEAGEYFIGSGFVAIQRYLTSTYCGLGISQSVAFNVPPIVNRNLKFAEAVNAGANYWKHVEEWIGYLNKAENVPLKNITLRTLDKLELATPWDDYTCANLLAVLRNGKELELSALLTEIAEWRNNLVNVA